MAEAMVLGAFAAALFVCILLDISILWALGLGFFLFFGYGLYKKHTAREMLRFALSGVKTVKNILVTFLLIGAITAVWRAAGTIPFIVYHATRFFDPRAMVLITFLMCCLISFLTGTAFGTAATMGVICVTMASGMGVPVLYTGGAVLAGSFFGDRCSPMSTSALLVSSLTGTDLFKNMATMVKTSVVPFVLTCAVYLWMGAGFDGAGDVTGVQTLFAGSFSLHPAAIVPAAVIVVFSMFRANVKVTMLASIVTGAAVGIFAENIAPAELLRIALAGFRPENAQVAQLLAGGGVVSMAKVFAIVCISSCYSGMFNGTGLLAGMRGGLEKAAGKLTGFGTMLLTSVLAGMIACNQTLSIMLTHQLCAEVEKDPATMASHLENTAVVVAPLVPWSIAGAVPLTSVGAPTVCVLTACYLYLVPLWNLLAAFFSKYKKKKRA